MYSVLVLPVIGGYFLATYGKHLKFRHQYLPPQRLLFHYIAIGAIALVLVGGLIELARFVFAETPWLSRENFGLAQAPEMAVPCLIAFAFLGFATLVTLPKAESRRKRLHPKLISAIEAVGDEMDVLLRDAFLNDEYLLVTLDNRKVYIAYVLSAPSPRQTRYVSIRPVFSGFRNERMEVELTTTFPAPEEGMADPYEVVIELADITSFAKWRPEVYEATFGKADRVVGVDAA